MNQVILFFQLSFFYVLFSWPVGAKLSNQEKKKFVEQLATTFPERKVFYRWQSEESREKFLEAGKWTPELYERYMEMSHSHFAGPGLYVSESVDGESLPPAADDGNTLLQVEVRLKYLDLSNEGIQQQLKEKEIDIYTLQELDLQMAIKYSRTGHDKWVLKGQKGIKFKPFSSHELSLKVLEKYYDNLSGERKTYFKATIREDIRNRVLKGESVYGSPFVDIMVESFGVLQVKSHLNMLNNITIFKTVKEITRWIRNGEQYLFDYNKRTLALKALNLPFNNIKEAVEFFQVAKPYLHRSDIDRGIKKIPITHQFEGELFLAQTGLNSSHSYTYPNFIRKDDSKKICKGEFEIPK